MILTKQELAHKAITIAESVGVDVALVCAIIEVSSGWNADMTEWAPSFWLMAQHPVDLGGQERWIALGTRWGPMQVLGQDAWLAGVMVERLNDVDENLHAGVLVLKSLTGTDGEILLRWFGKERRKLAIRALEIVPQFKSFVEARPCVSA